MVKKEEMEKAKNNILRGIDIESAAFILEKVILDNYVIVGGRTDILKLATRQILNFIENSKLENVGDKSILDYVKENVKLKEQIKQLKNQYESDYWKGYIERQKQAIEICEQCKYRKKAIDKEANNQILIEEIEKAKKEGYEIIGNFKSATTEITKDIFPKKAEAIEILLEYIEQLEHDKDIMQKALNMQIAGWNKGARLFAERQKLIEKLEEYITNVKKEKLPCFKTVADLIKYKGYAEGKIESCQEILSIVRGEKAK